VVFVDLVAEGGTFSGLYTRCGAGSPTRARRTTATGKVNATISATTTPTTNHTYRAGWWRINPSVMLSV